MDQLHLQLLADADAHDRVAAFRNGSGPPHQRLRARQLSVRHYLRNLPRFHRLFNQLSENAVFSRAAVRRIQLLDLELS